MMKLLLGGGGSAEDERPTFERFAAWVGVSGSVLYLPVAAGQAGGAYLDWISSALTPLGVRHIDMWTDLAGHVPAEINRHQAIFVGGGNTFSLLHRLRATGFDQALTGFVRRGGIVYGGSAGAIVMGRDIATSSHLDENAVGLADTAGLDLLGGDSIWCHYQSPDDGLIRAYVARTRSPTIALAETAGVWVRGPGQYILLGSEVVCRFTPDGKQQLA